MSNSQYLPDARYAQTPGPEPYGAGGAYVDLHEAETLAYGVYVAPGEYDDHRAGYDDPYRHGYDAANGPVYADAANGPLYGDPTTRPEYEDTYRPAYEAPAPPMPPPPPSPHVTLRLGEPLLPQQAVPASETPTLVGRRAARRRRARYAERPESTMRRLLPQALVVAFLAGGTTAFVAEDKAVELTVDGKPRTLHTFADDVTELLAEEGVRVGAHDLVAPARDADLASGDEIEVHYGRPVRLTLDGRRREVWTTARTVEGALRQLGVRAEGAYLSIARSQYIGRQGLALDVRTERALTVMADGRARTIRTNAATVREAVEEAGITLRGQDTTSVAPGSFPRDGQTVTVLRITGGKEVRDEPISFDVHRTADPSLFKGTEVVERAGRPGLRRITYSLRTVNGVRQKPKRIRTEVVREPRPQLVKVGTKPLPASVRGADGLDWQSLAACESGGRPRAVDPSGTYGGLYQFDTRTWQSLGGSGRPQDAPAAEQTFRAKKLYVSRGASPWPHCGTRLRG
ncbi:ubiquitin-like domain-containing protein [Streptomyces phaeofaciens]|uniref:ubiquitin-like domain-containing protein n=1 Tax=Streptomyces phaeofaciens TaxID=68254 RepID=UPI0036D114DA